jgi:hemerythrin superfamily protein
MSKMENMTVVEEEMFKFLKNNVYESAAKLKPELKKLLQKIKQFEKNRYQTRVFSYLDIISWVESKVYDKPMSTIVYDKYLQSRHR